jgi:thioredoxin-like negative regulator of GroEL
VSADGRRSAEDDAARTAITAAVERAAAEGKHALVVFGADWCGDSVALDQAFDNPLISALAAAGFETVRLDVGARDRHTAIAAGWGIDYANGIPAVAALDGDGELVAATTDGELRHARTLSPIEIAQVLHPLLPAAVTGAER